jgi:hypothetical protein
VIAAAPCGPRCGKSVDGLTKVGDAVILGKPACWCTGGAGVFEIRVVVAPAGACTTAGATARALRPGSVLTTMFDLDCAPGWLALSARKARARLFDSAVA